MYPNKIATRAIPKTTPPTINIDFLLLAISYIRGVSNYEDFFAVWPPALMGKQRVPSEMQTLRYIGSNPAKKGVSNNNTGNAFRNN